MSSRIKQHEMGLLNLLAPKNWMLFVVLSLLATSHAWAGSVRVWDNGAATGIWSNATNWNFNFVPGGTDTAQFDNSNTTASSVDASFLGTVGNVNILGGGTAYTGVITQNRALTVNNNFSIASGTYDLNGQTLTVNGNFTMTGGTFTGTGTLIVSGTLSISGGTFNANAGTIQAVGATTSITTASFNAGTGTLNFTGAAQAFNVNGGAGTYNNLTHSGSGTLSINNNNITLTGVLTNTSGTFNPNGHVITGPAAGTLSNTGTLLVDASTFSGNYASFTTRTMNAGSTVSYGANAAQTIDNTITYVNLNTGGNNTKTAGAALTVTNLTVAAATTFDPATFLVTGTGTLSNSGTILVDAATFAGNYTGFGTYTMNTTSTVNYSAAGAQTIDNSFNYGILVTSGSGTKTPAGALTVRGLTVGAGTTFNPAGFLVTRAPAGGTLSNSGTLLVDAATFAGNYTGFTTTTLNIGGSTVNYSANGAQTILAATYANLVTSGTNSTKTAAGAFTVANLTVGAGTTFNPVNFAINGGAGTLSNSGTIQVNTATFNGNYINFGTRTMNAGSIVVYAGGTQTIDAGIAYDTLNTAGTNTKSAGGSLSVVNLNVAVNTTFNPNGALVTGTGALSNSGTILVDAATFAGNYTGFVSYTMNTNSTVTYSANGAQTIDNTITYVNLNTAGSGTKSAAGALTVTNLTVAAGTKFDPATFLVTGTGTLSNSGTIFVDAATFALNYSFVTNTMVTGSTVTYNGAGAQAVDSTLIYSNLDIAGGGVKTAVGDLTLNIGEFNQSAATFDLNAHTMSIIRGNGAAPAGSFTLSGGTFDTQLTGAQTGGTILVGNDWTAIAGTFTARPTSTVNFVGATLANSRSDINVSALNKFFNLTHSAATASRDIRLLSAVEVLGTLTQSTGIFDVRGQNLVVDGPASITAGTLDVDAGTVTVTGTTTLSGGTLDLDNGTYTENGQANLSVGTLSGNNNATSTLVLNGDLLSGCTITNAPNITINGIGAQALQGFGAGQLLGNFTVSTAVMTGVKTVTGVFDVNGTVTVNNAGAVTDILTIFDAATSFINVRGTLVDNSAENIKGQLRATRTINNGNSNNFGGLGLTIADNGAVGGSPGSTTVRRYSKTSGVPVGETAGGALPNPVDRFWTILPTNATGQNATISFSFYSNEFAGTLANLKVYNNSGASWLPQPTNTSGNPTITDAITDFTATCWKLADFNLPPVITSNVITPGVVVEGSNVTMTITFTDANGSVDASNNTVNIDWKDGTPIDTITGVSSPFTRVHAMADDKPSGTNLDLVSPSVTVTDKNGGVSAANASQNVIVLNQIPSVAISTPVSPVEGTSITLTTIVTDPGVLDTFTYAWSLTKDGVAYTGPLGNPGPFNQSSLTFTPNDNGNYIAHLTVVDDDNGSTTVDSAPIVVGNVAPVIATMTLDTEINEGGTATLAGTITEPGSLDTLTLTIDWGDGSAVQNVPLSAGTASFSVPHIYVDDNPTATTSNDYTVSVTLTDKDSGTTLLPSTATVTVDNVAPSTLVLAPSTTTPGENSAMALSGTFVDPGTADTHTVVIDWGDGNTEPTINLGAGVLSFGPVTHTYPEGPASFTISVTVTDDDTDFVTNTVDIDVQNVVPSVVVNTLSTVFEEGTALDFDSTVTDVSSADSAALPAFTYAWSVTKDGNPYVSVTDNPGPFDQSTFEFTPNDNGSYIVTLNATDKDGGVGTGSTTAIIVSNLAPSASITGATTIGTEGTSISLGSSVSDPSSVDAATLTYAWSVTVGGNPYVSVTGNAGPFDQPTFSFTPVDNGSYVVTLVVTDKDGGSDTDATAPIVVGNVAPIIATMTLDTEINEGDTATLAGTITEPGSLDTLTLAINWDDGSAVQNVPLIAGSTSFSVTHVYVDDDPTATKFDDYTVSVTLTDKDSGTTVVPSTATVTVDNVAPSTLVLTPSTTTPNEGSLMTLSGTFVDPGTADTHTVVINWGDGNTEPTINLGAGVLSFGPVSHTYDDGSPTTYTISVTVMDDDTDFVNNTVDINVQNVAPTAIITNAPPFANEGDLITLGSSVSDPSSADTLFNYFWTITRNGVFYSTLSDSVGTYAWTPNDNGTYIVALTVTDKDSDSVVAATKTIQVANVAPTASIIAPLSSPEGTAINLSANVADVGTYDLLAYYWVVKKGGVLYTVGTAGTLNFMPLDNGSYDVALRVSDDDGGFVDAAPATIAVTNVVPTVNTVALTAAINEGGSATLSGNIVEAGILDTLTLAINWGDGSAVQSVSLAAGSTTFSVPHVYVDDNPTVTASDTYTVTGTITDKDGGSSSLGTNSITVNNVAPTVAITGAPATSLEAVPISLSSTVTDPGTADTFTYFWSVTKNTVAFGTNGTAASYSFTPDDNGTYVVTLTVTDDDGGVDTDVATIAVTNVNPSVSIVGAPQLSPEGTPIALTSSVSDPAPPDTFTYLWTVTKNGSPFGVNGTLAAYTFTPDDNGNFIVTLLVTDKDGGTRTDSKLITATNVNPKITINGAPVTTHAGTPLTLTSTVTDKGAADTFTYDWRVTKNGVPFASGTQSSLTFTPVDDAIYEVGVTVSDDDDGTGVARVVITSQAPPVFTSGPTPDANPAKPLQVVHFTVAATDADAITYSWNFGDGTSDNSNSTSVSHAFSPKGTYVVTVTATDANGLAASMSVSMLIDPTLGLPVPPGTEIDSDGDGVTDNVEVALGTDPNDANSSPLTGGPGGAPKLLTITKMGIKLNFTKPNSDTIALSGLISITGGFTPAGKSMLVDVGGVIRNFTLDSKGNSKIAGDAIKLAVQRLKGAVTNQLAKVTLKVTRANIAPDLTDEGLTKAVDTGIRNVIVTIILDKTLYQTTRAVLYTNTLGTSGSAK